MSRQLGCARFARLSAAFKQTYTRHGLPWEGSTPTNPSLLSHASDRSVYRSRLTSKAVSRKKGSAPPVSPLVVVPGHHLDHVVTHNHGQRRVDRGRRISAPEVHGHLRSRADSASAHHRRPQIADPSVGSRLQVRDGPQASSSRGAVGWRVMTHQRLLSDIQDALHGASGVFAESLVDLLGKRLLLDLHHQVDDGHVGGRHAECDTCKTQTPSVLHQNTAC